MPDAPYPVLALALMAAACSGVGGAQDAAHPTAGARDDAGHVANDAATDAATEAAHDAANDGAHDAAMDRQAIPSPDGGTHTPSCTHLPDVGTWENITPPGVTESDAFAIDPFDPATIYTTAVHQGVYRSTDCGGSWTLVNTGENGAMIGTGARSAMVLDPVDHGTMYISMYMGPLNLWKSINGGVDWRPLIDPASDIGQRIQYRWFQSIGMDPTDHLHLVASTHSNCNPPAYSVGCQVESVDGGATWSLVLNPQNASWAEQGGALALGSSLWIYGQPFGKLWITRDHGATWEDRTPPGQAGTTGGFIGAPIIGSDGNYYLPTLSGVIRSANGLTWENLPGLAGRSVGMAGGNGYIFTADQWSPTYRMAALNDLSHWTDIPPPAALKSDQGGPHLHYEPTHHLLFSSNWSGGMWRTRVP